MFIPGDGRVSARKLAQLIRQKSHFTIAFSSRSIKLWSNRQRFYSSLESHDEFESWKRGNSNKKFWPKIEKKAFAFFQFSAKKILFEFSSFYDLNSSRDTKKDKNRCRLLRNLIERPENANVKCNIRRLSWRWVSFWVGTLPFPSINQHSKSYTH